MRQLTTDSPPSAALSFNVRRLLRRAAALAWMAPTFAARSSAERAFRSASRVASASPCWALSTAFATKVLAADRRGWRTA